MRRIEMSPRGYFEHVEEAQQGTRTWFVPPVTLAHSVHGGFVVPTQHRTVSRRGRLFCAQNYENQRRNDHAYQFNNVNG